MGRTEPLLAVVVAEDEVEDEALRVLLTVVVGTAVDVVIVGVAPVTLMLTLVPVFGLMTAATVVEALEVVVKILVDWSAGDSAVELQVTVVTALVGAVVPAALEAVVVV